VVGIGIKIYTWSCIEFTAEECYYLRKMKWRNVHPLARACLPNFLWCVPYLNTPPIKPGQTLKYEFPINQSGTYWYHSHTMLQEQRSVWIYCYSSQRNVGVWQGSGADVIRLTNEKPMNVLRNLKRGNEWYGIRKGTSTPLNKVIARGAFEHNWLLRQRMGGWCRMYIILHFD
jgi:hypothetical protein